MSASHRILSLDVGKKRIGLAMSDELGLTAQGLPTLERRGRREDIEWLRRFAVKHGVTSFLVGNPLHMNGEQSAQAEYTIEFTAELERKTHLPVVMLDERLTSWEAARRLRGADIPEKDRRAAIDMLSAVILLQEYLDANTREQNA